MQPKQRIYYLDWLRVSAFGVLILFHSWQPFTNFNWFLNSSHKSIVADIFSVFFHTWRLHLIFFVSGVGTWLAIRSRGSQFFRDRFQRLIIPFIFGALVIVPCQYYYQQLQQPSSIRFTDFMIHYPAFIASRNYGFDLFSWILEIGIHLWYLPYLFIMTLITYPLLKRINATGLSETVLQKLTKHPSLILLLALPVIFTIILLQPLFPEYTSVADFLTYAFFFVYGFMLMREHARLLPILNKNTTILLILGIISSLLLISFLLIDPLRKAAFDPKYDLDHVIVSIPLGLSAFSWPLYFVSLFSRHFNVNSQLLPELNRSVLPVYIVHQSIIVVAGYYIIKYIDTGFLEFILIVFTTIVLSGLAFYFIKKFRATRVVFGLKG